MSYVIQYQGDLTTKQIKYKTKTSWLGIMVLSISIGLIVSILIFGRNNVIDFFIPGEADVTKAVWNTMIHELENGTQFGEAVAVFCRSVLEYEKVA